ncbi:UNVERIFIED_CONTAM: hypothetical protein Slati_2653900 [Sesamum latifolium]|uniref:Uncharacterized protein n=1 Tax=Sesamum latifolium TaxID=2727402 RepID=A0AAW2VZA5_9LAMI
MGGEDHFSYVLGILCQVVVKHGGKVMGAEDPNRGGGMWVGVAGLGQPRAAMHRLELGAEPLLQLKAA